MVAAVGRVAAWEAAEFAPADLAAAGAPADLPACQSGPVGPAACLFDQAETSEEFPAIFIRAGATFVRVTTPAITGPVTAMATATRGAASLSAWVWAWRPIGSTAGTMAADMAAVMAPPPIARAIPTKRMSQIS